MNFPLKRRHLSEEQKESMVSFMERHGDLSSYTYNSISGKRKKIKLLKELANILNSCKDGVVRTPKEWLDTWRYNKSKIKSKALQLARYQKHVNVNDVNELPPLPLTPIEERVVSLMPIDLDEGIDFEKLKVKCKKEVESEMEIVGLDSDYESVKRKHLTEEQKEIIVSFMETYGDISAPIYNTAKGKLEKLKLMTDLTAALNSCKNGVVRTPSEWLKCWKHNKSKIRSKALKLAHFGRGDDNSLNELPPLTSIEERIIGLMPEVYDGINDLGEDSLKQSSEDEELRNTDEFTETWTSNSDYETNDHDYYKKEVASRNSDTPISEAIDGKETVRCMDMENGRAIKDLLSELIKAQQGTTEALINLSISFREGCKEIVESHKCCNCRCKTRDNCLQ